MHVVFGRIFPESPCNMFSFSFHAVQSSRVIFPHFFDFGVLVALLRWSRGVVTMSLLRDIEADLVASDRAVHVGLTSPMQFFSPESEAIGVLTSSIGGVACLRFGALAPLHGAGCCCRVLLSEWCVRYSGHAGVAAGCHLQVLLLEWCVHMCALWSWHVGAAAGWCRCKVLIQGAAFGVACLVWSWLSGAAARCLWKGVAAGCSCRMLLQGAAVMLVPLQGAAAGWGCRVLQWKGCLHLRNWGAATGYCCQSAVCAMKLGCWCRCRGWLRDVYGSVASGSDGDYVFAIANKASDCHHNIFWLS